MKVIKRLLIANRGEIACRIMRTAKKLGMETIAVYSEADANALHVSMADHALPIGPAPANESYLVAKNIIAAAKAASADAVHPGYGFLSENAEFARACAAEGVIFVGPSPEAISVMGDKARAKRAMIAAGVPCVPGYQGDDQSQEVLIAEAARIGFPLMVKAAAGGGGRGMRLVSEASQLMQAIETAKSEALSAFGADALILEKAIVRPRHVELQVFGDAHGNLIHLGERDCSVQRRHQKVIEEAPCPVMTADLREAMGTAAIAAARAVAYEGAGTVEFLLGEDRSFYFLEMNTRLQVEHPVTEQITGIDLVELQLNVAAGQKLGLEQADIKLSGHAIEARLYAEDPANDFLPSAGPVSYWKRPSGEGVRVDAGVSEGGEVSPHYDSMIAKVIATGGNREEARRRLLRALGESMLAGAATNRDFLIDALGREVFIAGAATTAFVAEEYGNDGFEGTPDISDYCKAAVIHYQIRRAVAKEKALNFDSELLGWASAGALHSAFAYCAGGEEISVSVAPLDARVCRVSAGDVEMDIKIDDTSGNSAILDSNGYRETIVYWHADDGSLVFATPHRLFQLGDAARAAGRSDAHEGGRVMAPMHGLVIDIFVEEDACVEKGERLATLEAMKMQHEIVAKISGRVASISAQAGTQIGAGDVIMEIEASQ